MHRISILPVSVCLALVVAMGGAAAARDPEPLPGVSRVSAGDTHTCAEWWFGASCWGDNDEGKLGNGTQSGLLLAPIAPPPIVPEAVFGPRSQTAGTPFAGLDAGPSRTCGLATGQAGTTAGEAWCWGGDVGLGRVCMGPGPWTAPGVVMRGPPGDDEGPQRCGAAPLAPVFSVAVAERWSCALVGSPYDGAGGEVWCWGGPGGQAEILAHPLLRPDGEPMTSIDLLDGAFDRFCAITTDGAVWCWGDRLSETPRQISGVADAVAVAVGEDHACAQVRDGSIWCWGANDHGQLGDGTTDPSDVAVRVAGLDETSAAEPSEPGAFLWWRGRRVLAAGRAHSCVLRDEPGAQYEHDFERADAVFCWGANGDGQLGDGSRDRRTLPVRVVDLDPAKGVFDLALGAAHSCTVTGETVSVSHPDPTMGGIVSDRMLRCWGANDDGQLGTGDRDSRTRPTTVVMTHEPRLATSPD